MNTKLAPYLLLVLGLAATTVHATVKQSSSGICHSADSPYYERTKNFKPFATLDACLQSGGRLPQGMSASAGATLVAVQNQAVTGYSRAQFGKGWADNDGDCQNSRHEALIKQSTGPVRFKAGRECQVTAGRWISPYTGAVIHDPSRIDIDHVVPLKWAWEHGADKWPQSKRDRFANDPVNLLSVEASLNRQKGAKGLDEWLPPANQCQYVARFMRVMKAYKLELSPLEAARYANVRQRRC